MSSFVHAAKKIRDILIYGDGLTQGLDDTILRAEVFVLSVHYHGSNNFLFVNTTKKSLFKAIDSEIKYYTLCLFRKHFKRFYTKIVISDIQFGNDKNNQKRNHCEIKY